MSLLQENDSKDPIRFHREAAHLGGAPLEPFSPARTALPPTDGMRRAPGRGRRRRPRGPAPPALPPAPRPLCAERLRHPQAGPAGPRAGLGARRRVRAAMRRARRPRWRPHGARPAPQRAGRSQTVTVQAPRRRRCWQRCLPCRRRSSHSSQQGPPHPAPPAARAGRRAPRPPLGALRPRSAGMAGNPRRPGHWSHSQLRHLRRHALPPAAGARPMRRPRPASARPLHAAQPRPPPPRRRRARTPCTMSHRPHLAAAPSPPAPPLHCPPESPPP